MLVSFDKQDSVLSNQQFLKEEACYQLVYLISQNPQALRLKYADDTLLFVQSSGQKGWLWVNPQLNQSELDERLSHLITKLPSEGLPGITGRPELAKQAALLYAEANSRKAEQDMIMEVYECPLVIPMQQVGGEAILATKEHNREIATFLAGFAEEAYGTGPVQPASQQQAATSLIEGQQLYMWRQEDGSIVGMANIADRSPRHGRINAVYTAPGYRGQGIAGALVASLSDLIHKEERLPMLYADSQNSSAAKAYRRVGFVIIGLISAWKFA